MELEQAKKLINNLESSKAYRRYVREGRRAQRYYKSDNDIKRRGRRRKKADVFRVSDHRIASNLFRVLVDQKASYLFGIAPVIDVGDPVINEKINRILGDQWGKNLKRTCVLCSLWGDAWWQYWVNEEGKFKYTVIPSPDNVLASWGGYSNEELVQAVKRALDWLDPETGEYWNIYEIWTQFECFFYRHPSDGNIDNLIEERNYQYFNVDLNEFDESNRLEHDYGEVNFIHWKNNADCEGDLKSVKDLIDSYDESMSNIADVITDSENVIFVIKGYGDQDADEFWENVQENRIISLVDSDEEDGLGDSDAKILAIEPPIAATTFNLEHTKKQIYEQGGGVDHNFEMAGNTSGEALKHQYNLLELRALTVEEEFRISIARLVKAICKYLGYEIPEGQVIKQTWKRSRINNDTELAEIARSSSDILSHYTVLKNHPWVDDPDEELNRIKEEKAERMNEAFDRAQEDLIYNFRQRETMSNDKNMEATNEITDTVKED